MLCAECLRCGRRSILGRGADAGALALPDPAAPGKAERLRCDMCGGRRVRVVKTASPAELVAFVAGRI